MGRHRRLAGRHPHHGELLPASLAQLQDPRRQRRVTGHVQRVHGRRGAVAGVWLVVAGLADCGGECDYAGAGAGYFGDEVGLRPRRALNLGLTTKILAMTQKINSASRLFRILERHSSHADNVQTIDAWAGLLDVTEAHPHRRIFAVGELVHAMHRELEHAAAGLASANFSKNLYENAFSRIEHALSPMQFPSSWNHVKQHLAPEVLTALAFSSEILPNEETQISVEEMGSIRSKLDELRGTLEDSSLPRRLRSLIEHHVELIERALAEYPVVGAIALREAGRTALGEMIEAKDELASVENNPSVSKLKAAWKTVNEAADFALKAEGVAQLGQQAWQAISKLWP